MKNFKGILKAAICSIAGILIMTGCTNYSKMLKDEPQEYVSLASENTAKAMVKGSFAEEYRLLEEASKNGSFSIEFEAEGIRFGGECYVNEKDEMSSQMYTLTGSKGTSAQIYAFAGKNSMKLGEIGNSGTHVYSFDMNNLADKLAGSIFDPDSGSSYAMSEEDYKMFLEYAAELDSAITGKNEKNSDDTYSKYDEMIKTFLDENLSETSEKNDVTINGEAVLANIVRYDFSKEALKDMTEKLIDEVMEDEAALDAAGYSKENIEEAETEIMSVLDELDDFNIKLAYYVNSNTNQLMETDMTVSAVNEEASGELYFSIVYGADPAHSEKQSIVLKIKQDYPGSDYYSDSETEISADIIRSENRTETVINFTEDGEANEVVTIVSEKNGETYTVTAQIPDLEATAGMTGTIVKDKDSFEMTIDRLFLNYGSTEMAYLPKAVISVKKGGEMLDLDAEKEFLDITEEELDDLLENIESDFEAVFMEFAEDSVLGKSMLGYAEKAKISSANANAKLVNTALAVQLTMMNMDDESLIGNVITGESVNVIIDGNEIDMTDYLGSNFHGYLYAEVVPYAYAVDYALWSEEPIPNEYRHQLSSSEQQSLADDGIIIGCYPFSSYV